MFLAKKRVPSFGVESKDCERVNFAIQPQLVVQMQGRGAHNDLLHPNEGNSPTPGIG